MIEAYRKLENGSSRGQRQDEYSKAFDSAIADIQLLGSPEQVEKAKKIAKMLGSGTGAPVSINELLFSLRNDLRQELNLGPIGDEIIILRSRGELEKK